MGIGKFPFFPISCLCDSCDGVHPALIHDSKANVDAVILAATVDDIHFVVRMLRDIASSKECEYSYVFSNPCCSEVDLMDFIATCLSAKINQALLVNNKQSDYVDLRSFRVSSFSEN